MNDFMGYKMNSWMECLLFSMMGIEKETQILELERQCQKRKKKYFKYLALPNIFVYGGVFVSLILEMIGGVLAELAAFGEFFALIGFFMTVVSTYKYMKWADIDDSMYETGNTIYESTYNPYTNTITTKERAEYSGGWEWLKIGAAIYLVGVIYYLIKVATDRISLNNAKKYLNN